jgi:hypothetical protein
VLVEERTTVRLEEGKTHRVRYLAKVQGGQAEPREGAMEVQQGIAVLLHSNLEGKIERFTIDSAQLNASDDPDLDFIYLGSVLKPTI